MKCSRRTPQGVRGLKFNGHKVLDVTEMSHPARGAWIEMTNKKMNDILRGVAPRKGCVD